MVSRFYFLDGKKDFVTRLTPSLCGGAARCCQASRIFSTSDGAVNACQDSGACSGSRIVTP